MTKEILNIGCGKDIMEDAINLDIIKLKGVDVIHDLEKIPLPFKDNSFIEIYAYSVLEHIENFMDLMEEIYRILKPNGMIYIAVPHYMHKDTFTDPTHKRGFTDKSFQYFEEDCDLNFYTKARFKVERVNNVPNNQHLYFFIPFKRLVGRLWCNLLRGIEFDLRVIK